jgi:hypothetical protein
MVSPSTKQGIICTPHPDPRPVFLPAQNSLKNPGSHHKQDFTPYGAWSTALSIPDGQLNRQSTRGADKKNGAGGPAPIKRESCCESGTSPEECQNEKHFASLVDMTVKRKPEFHVGEKKFIPSR